MATDITAPDPTIVLDLLEAFRRSQAMFTAVSLGVFDALADGPKSTPDLARQLQASPDALGRLLDACVGLRLLAREGDRYGNTPATSAYLRPELRAVVFDLPEAVPLAREVVGACPVADRIDVVGGGLLRRPAAGGRPLRPRPHPP